MEQEMATHSNTLASKVPWAEAPGGATVHGVTKSQTFLSVHKHTHLSVYSYFQALF